MERLPLLPAEELPGHFTAEDHFTEEFKEESRVIRRGEWRLQTSPLHRMMEHNPEVHELYTNGFLTLWREEVTGLTPRQRELVILTVARYHECRVLWNVHLQMADSEGITHEEMEAVFDGHIDVLEADDALLVDYVIAVCDFEVTDELHARLADRFDERTIVGIIVLAGYYTLSSMAIDALDIITATAPDHVSLSYEALTDG
ncbi:MAG: carboxymuconolactone decarboxylase family protein [Halobacteriales archaeon]|nr:carboxymuconolactone decarboxylase family protein [Halobacteriales archaeon]